MNVIREGIYKHPNPNGIIIEGFPRTIEQVQEYEKFVSGQSAHKTRSCFDLHLTLCVLQIGRCDLCFVLDCEEHLMQQRLLKRGAVTGRVDDNLTAVARRINFYKDKTLEAIKHFDDKGKVAVVSILGLFLRKICHTGI